MNSKKILFSSGIFAKMLVAALSLAVLTSCAGNKGDNGTDEESRFYDPVEKYDFSQVDPNGILSLDYTLDKFFEGVKIETVTQEQVNNDLASYLEMYPVYEKIKNRTVEAKDLVNVDYACVDKESSYTVSGGIQENIILDLMDNDLPQDVLDEFVGASVGTSFQKEAIAKDVEGSFWNEDGEEIMLEGRTLIFDFTVNYICGAQRTTETLTDSDVYEITDADYETVPEFMEFIRESLQASCEEAAAEEVWDLWIPECKVEDEDKLMEYADLEFQYEMGFYQMMADVRGLGMDALAALYGCDSQVDFEATVQEDSINIVKQYLLTNYIAKKEGLFLDEAGLLSEAEKLAKEYGLNSPEELWSSYGTTEINLFLQMRQVDHWIAKQLYSHMVNSPFPAYEE